MGENHDCAECPKPLVELKSMQVVGDIPEYSKDWGQFDSFTDAYQT